MSTQSPLLDLPAEVRNRVYEFVLFSPTPLYLRSLEAPRHIVEYTKFVHRFGTSTPAMRYEEFNKLKYVNKHLNCETASLEFKYNDVTVSFGALVDRDVPAY